jgi:hypothetical protein
MFKRLSAAAAALSVSLFSGCAIHPVPEDVTGVTTYHIVRQIRCEAREALRKMVIDWLRDLGTDYPNQPADLRARGLAELYEANPDEFSKFGPQLFPEARYAHVREVINLFADAGIAYNFDLKMTEDNNLGGTGNFLKPLFSGMFTLGVTADANRQRQNERTFTITDKFSYLVTTLNTPVRGVHYCDGYIVLGPNYIYPIVGNIGVYKSIRTFVELTLFGNLAPQADKGKMPDTAGAPTMVDDLTFTTTVDASATPKVAFNQAGTNFQVMDASLTPKVDRMDVHEVTIAVAVAAKNASLDPLRQYLFSKARTSQAAGTNPGIRKLNTGTLYVGSRVTGGGSPSEILAVMAIDQVKSRELKLITPLN